MEIYAILSGKGGTGKTTLAVHFAVAAERSGQKSIVVDPDPQGSATDWGTFRQAETPVVVAADPTRLADILKTAEANAVDVAVIDTATHTNRDVYTRSPAQIAASLASLVIIPCRASIFDLRAIAPTVEIATHAKVPAIAVLNAVPSRGKRAAEARTAIETYNIACAPCDIGERVAFVHAATEGRTAIETQPKSKVATEVLALYNHIQHRREK